MQKIAISYRRDDTEPVVGRIRDRLVAHYGSEAVFLDVNDIPPGVDFREHIAAVWDQSAIVLVVIGPRWIGMRRGQSRLHSPDDPVRVEVETALRRGIPVIPILIDRVRMPKQDQLPETLKDFAFRSGLVVDSGVDFDHHVSRLLRAMDDILETKPPRQCYVVNVSRTDRLQSTSKKSYLAFYKKRLEKNWASYLATFGGIRSILILSLLLFAAVIAIWAAGLKPPFCASPVSGVLTEVEGVAIKILDVRRSRDGIFVELNYSVTTGSTYSRHDPAHFVRLASDGKAVAPEWTSASARDLPPNGEQQILVKFRSSPGASQCLVFRFGDTHPIDVAAKALD